MQWRPDGDNYALTFSFRDRLLKLILNQFQLFPCRRMLCEKLPIACARREKIKMILN